MTLQPWYNSRCPDSQFVYTHKATMLADSSSVSLNKPPHTKAVFHHRAAFKRARLLEQPPHALGLLVSCGLLAQVS